MLPLLQYQRSYRACHRGPDSDARAYTHRSQVAHWLDVCDAEHRHLPARAQPPQRVGVGTSARRGLDFSAAAAPQSGSSPGRGGMEAVPGVEGGGHTEAVAQLMMDRLRKTLCSVVDLLADAIAQVLCLTDSLPLLVPPTSASSVAGAAGALV